ncbi:MAG: hypothetical protein RLN87_09195 [Parasphingopyxis sp.]|uniref:DUF6692 family protein n=1 Tax=Parasphingopyxis sp. TaxID=1920299 RepID=UPI0032ED3569
MDPLETAAPIRSARDALANVSTAIIKPETISDADMQALGPDRGECTFRLTEVSFPVLVYGEGTGAIIKLNGSLIPLRATGPGEFASGDLRVNIRMLESQGGAGLHAMEMVVIPPGAEDELGYHGFRHCAA